jgi:5-oxoprolinase (ATP-hydrolysing)
VYAQVPIAPGFIVHKLLSVNPTQYDDAPTEGIRVILERVTGVAIPRGAPIPCERIESIRMGTTVATNALLERKGVKTMLVTTAGFRDILAIGNQARPAIFDLHIRKPELIYDEVYEVAERVRVVPRAARRRARAAQSIALMWS